MAPEKPHVLSIAGFDPTGGAGVLADIKTFENNNVYGLGVCSAITIQNDIKFKHVKWVELAFILEQIDILIQRYSVKWIKIGLIENYSIMLSIIDHIYAKQPDTKIVWDPILVSSTGYRFHNDFKTEYFENICKKIFLITPNIYEMSLVYPEVDVENCAQKLSQYCNVLLKGGHSTGPQANDILFSNRKQYTFAASKINDNEKHGTGCVLSAAILSNLGNGKSLPDSCKQGKKYTEQFISSNLSLLGYHKVLS